MKTTIKEIAKIVAQYTDNNQHGEAKEYICTRLGYTHLKIAFSLINKLHYNDGHLYQHLEHYRAQKNKEMFDLIEKDHGIDARHEIYGAM